MLAAPIPHTPPAAAQVAAAQDLVAASTYLPRLGCFEERGGGQWWVVCPHGAWLVAPASQSPETLHHPQWVAVKGGQLYLSPALLRRLVPGAAELLGPSVSASASPAASPAQQSRPAAPAAAPTPRSRAPQGLVNAYQYVVEAGGNVLQANGQWWITYRGGAWLVYPPTASPLTLNRPQAVAVRDGQLFMAPALLQQLVPPAAVAASVYGVLNQTPFGPPPSYVLQALLQPPALPPAVPFAGDSAAAVAAAVAARWGSLVQQAASPRVPAVLLEAIMVQESGGQSRVVSSAGAVGLMQVLPGLAHLPGAMLKIPAVNLWIAASELRRLAREFGLSAQCWVASALSPECAQALQDVLIGYNAGPAAVPEGWAIPEVRRYVADVEALLGLLGGLPGSGP